MTEFEFREKYRARFPDDPTADEITSCGRQGLMYWVRLFTTTRGRKLHSMNMAQMRAAIIKAI